MTKNSSKKKLLRSAVLSTIVDKTVHDQIVIYRTEGGRSPFIEWLESLDHSLKRIIHLRLDRVLKGNLGNFKSLGKGLFELKFKFGLRIYYALENSRILLLLGGDKGSQKRDIEKARTYLQMQRTYDENKKNDSE